MNLLSMALAGASLGAAPVIFWLVDGWPRLPAAGMVASFGAWQLYCAIAMPAPEDAHAVLRLWGLTWTRDEACCHFLVTGATGTGKTARAIVPIVHGLRETLPQTGVLAIDSKGALWRPLERIAKALGQERDLRLIRVRPPHVPPDQWTPPLQLNLLEDRSVPWTTYAKVIVDAATSAGQKGGQTFFKETARDLIMHAMQALDLAALPVTLDNVHNVICISTDTVALIDALKGIPGPAAAAEVQYFKDFHAQPPEQKAGTVSTVANFLRPYTPKDIADVFCCSDPSFSLSEVDAGRLVCLSIPQVFQLERKYLNLLCKQLFFLHAFRRFDLDAEELLRRNMIVLVLDEGQKTTLVSEDGFSDHTTVDELREAGVCLISATQTPVSFYASFENEKKADVFMANLRTQIHFRAADEKGAKILSEKIGARPVRKWGGGVSGGKSSRSWQPVDEPWFKPHELLQLSEGSAVMRHPRLAKRPLVKRMKFGKFTVKNEHHECE